MTSTSMTRPRRGLLTNEPVILLALVLIGLYFAREVLIPLAMAVTLNFLLAPAVIFFERLQPEAGFRGVLVVFMAVGGGRRCGLYRGAAADRSGERSAELPEQYQLRAW